jgi:L-aminopeptidase/D-esterase-like protein
LSAIAGVMENLRKKGIGYKVEDKIVPIVSGAVIYDLNDKEYHYPDLEMGYTACENATEDNVLSGNVGAGIGAVVGKVRGLKYSDKAGLGIGSVKVEGITLTAVIVVNALGDIYNHNNEIIAGAKDNKGNFLNTQKCILDGAYLRLIMGTNTTIGCILTDAKLNKVEANKLASISHNGLAQSIRPVHTDYDGDTMFCLATGKKKVLNKMLLEVGVVEAVRLAIEDSIK